MDAPAVVDAEVCTAEFVEADAEAGAITGGNVFVVTGGGFGKRLGIGEDDASEQAVGSKSKAVFRLEVQHIFTSETSLDITACGIAIGIPACTGEQEVRGFAAACRKPVVTPEGQNVVGGGREVDVFAQVEDEGLPVPVAAKKGEIGPPGDTGIIAFPGVDGVSSAIKKKVQTDTSRDFLLTEAIPFEVCGLTGWRVYFLYIPEIVEIISQTEVKVPGDGL